MIVDQINSPVDDRVQVEEWFNSLDYKRICEPLIIKPIVHPFKLPKVERVTDQQIQWLKDWASVWASVWSSVGSSVGSSVRASVGASVGAYTSSFFDIPYKYNYSPCINLWEAGLVPSFDGKTWRLHSGESVEVVYTWEVVTK